MAATLPEEPDVDNTPAGLPARFPDSQEQGVRRASQTWGLSYGNSGARGMTPTSENDQALALSR